MPSVSNLVYFRGTKLFLCNQAEVYDLEKAHQRSSCMLCQQRKVRGDQQTPCANCIRAQVECTVMALVPPKPRKKKQTQSLDGALVDQLYRCETLLAPHGVDVDEALAAPSSRPSREPASASAATDGTRTPREVVRALQRGEVMSCANPKPSPLPPAARPNNIY
jgi:hypothetical protein